METNTTKPTSRTRQAIEIVLALGDAIRDLGSVPSGELYARVMDKLSLQNYEAAIRLLKNADLVKESGNLLTWIGPRKEAN